MYEILEPAKNCFSTAAYVCMKSWRPPPPPYLQSTSGAISRIAFHRNLHVPNPVSRQSTFIGGGGSVMYGILGRAGGRVSAGRGYV